MTRTVRPSAKPSVKASVLAALLASTSCVAAQGETAGRFVVVPNGWAWFLAAFVLAAGVLAAAAYLYGRATKPQKAAKYAVNALKHLFLWVAVLVTLYPVVYLVGVSFNRNNALATVPPREGNLFVRSGILPDPADFSLVQYGRVLGDTHLYGYQWVAVGGALLALFVFLLTSVFQRWA